MSVRRLAEDTLQPEGFAFDRARSAEARVWIGKYPSDRQWSAVIPLLMLAQEQEGWVTRAAIEHVAEVLDMPLIRVMEVATFYTQFQLQPVGTMAHVQVCGTTPCMLRGAEDLKAVCRRKINEQPFAPNAEGTLSWEEVECQGACVNAPMVMIGPDTYEDLTPERLEEIIDAFEAGHGGRIAPGPQIDRIRSAPASGLTTLLDVAEDTASAQDAGSGPDARAPEPGSEEAGKGRAKSAGKAPPRAKAPSPTEAIAATASEVRPRPRRRGKGVDSGNPTMKLAATASGRAEKPRRRSELTGSESPAASAKARSAPGRPASPLATTEPTATGNEPGDKASAAPPTGRGAASDPVVKPASATGVAAQGSRTRDNVVGGADDAASPDRPRAKQGTSDAGRPAAMERPGEPDDLKLISGVGPKLEEKLNGLGIYTFDQIARWKKAEREWVDGYLSFKGRIERDDWVRQAKALAKGGVDEYARVFGKKPR
ncbi:MULTISPECIES: NADH-quinone oxidoreductase subunit NuoE [unclassified Roseitalea]|uniref:NADH-quinone oxidoreductase subunit NuoE n=1 Tax=unclassified Roseitalea TaxID=2639107 RepID=UPI00274001DB|nr:MULTISPECIES: NADH-quinone oxidoreductase subunit NuoE [unclassified Roseitalea]